jgi:hypothetical protein
MKRCFEIPEKLTGIYRQVLGMLVEKVPDGWSIVSGVLEAPKWMIDTGEALVSTKLVFASSIVQMIQRTSPEVPADYLGIFAGKLALQYEFGHNFTRNEVLPMSQAKTLISALVQKGYRGRIEFKYREAEDREPVDFRFGIWLPTVRPDELPSIYFEINAQDTWRNGATIAPLLESCERLKLSELVQTAK